MKKEDLEDKTIFDFCKDKEMLREIIGGDYSENYYRGFHKTAILRDLMEYAYKTQNVELYACGYPLYEEACKELLDHPPIDVRL